MKDSPVEQAMLKRGISLPVPPKPVGSYVPVLISGKLAFISGQIPIEDGKVKFRGKLGKETAVEAGQQAAKLCVINGLAQLKLAAGSLDRVARFVKLTGFVNSDAGFTDHSKVVDGASDFIVDIFGEKGKHARAAVGVSSLPLDSCVEVEFIVELG